MFMVLVHLKACQNTFWDFFVVFRHFLHKNLFLKIDPKKLVDTIMLVDNQTLVLPEAWGVLSFHIFLFIFILLNYELKNEPKAWPAFGCQLTFGSQLQKHIFFFIYANLVILLYLVILWYPK